MALWMSAIGGAAKKTLDTYIELGDFSMKVADNARQNDANKRANQARAEAHTNFNNAQTDRKNNISFRRMESDILAGGMQVGDEGGQMNLGGPGYDTGRANPGMRGKGMPTQKAAPNAAVTETGGAVAAPAGANAIAQPVKPSGQLASDNKGKPVEGEPAPREEFEKDVTASSSASGLRTRDVAGQRRRLDAGGDVENDLSRSAQNLRLTPPPMSMDDARTLYQMNPDSEDARRNFYATQDAWRQYDADRLAKFNNVSDLRTAYSGRLTAAQTRAEGYARMSRAEATARTEIGSKWGQMAKSYLDSVNPDLGGVGSVENEPYVIAGLNYAVNQLQAISAGETRARAVKTVKGYRIDVADADGNSLYKIPIETHEQLQRFVNGSVVAGMSPDSVVEFNKAQAFEMTDRDMKRELVALQNMRTDQAERNRQGLMLGRKVLDEASAEDSFIKSDKILQETYRAAELHKDFFQPEVTRSVYNERTREYEDIKTRDSSFLDMVLKATGNAPVEVLNPGNGKLEKRTPQGVANDFIREQLVGIAQTAGNNPAAMDYKIRQFLSRWDGFDPDTQEKMFQYIKIRGYEDPRVQAAIEIANKEPGLPAGAQPQAAAAPQYRGLFGNYTGADFK